MADKPYSGALLTLIDRDSQAETKTLAYPITRISLYEFTGTGLEIVRTFVVDDSGRWVEEQ